MICVQREVAVDTQPWQSIIIAPQILNLSTSWGEWWSSCLCHFTARGESLGPSLGCWMGPRAALDAMAERYIPAPFSYQTMVIQPVLCIELSLFLYLQSYYLKRLVYMLTENCQRISRRDLHLHLFLPKYILVYCCAHDIGNTFE